MTVIIEGANRFYVGAAAAIIEDGRELAWAERFVSKQDDVKWILGNFVEADNANSNGHIFPLGHLRTARESISHKPLNMLHREHYIVGCFVGQELLEPGGETAGAGVTNPHVEALSAYWRYYFPSLYDEVVEPAHKEGTLFYSMEAIPKTLTCEGGCGKEFAYKGRTHETYCDHLNLPGAHKRLNNPHFTAGALIVPPVLPGWKRADITQLAHLNLDVHDMGAMIEHNLEAAEMAYDQFSVEFPHLEPKQWEAMMLQAMATATAGITIDPRTGKSSPSSVSTFQMSPEDMDENRPTLPDGTYMVIDETTLRQAVNLADQPGVAGPDVMARCHILRRADKLGLMNQPDVAETLTEWRGLYPNWKNDQDDQTTEDDALLAHLGFTAEQISSLGFGMHADYDLAYEIARDFAQPRRMDLAKKGLAMPDGSYPIVTVGDLRNAIRAVGRAAAGKRSSVMAWIKRRAVALGATKLLPPAWTAAADKMQPHPYTANGTGMCDTCGMSESDCQKNQA